MKIAFDVDDTLLVPSVASGFGRDTPNYGTIQVYKWFQQQGHFMVIWSGSGIDWAKTWAEKFGLTADDFPMKGAYPVDIAFDDCDVSLGRVNVKVKRVNNGVDRREWNKKKLPPKETCMSDFIERKAKEEIKQLFLTERLTDWPVPTVRVNPDTLITVVLDLLAKTRFEALKEGERRGRDAAVEYLKARGIIAANIAVGSARFLSDKMFVCKAVVLENAKGEAQKEDAGGAAGKGGGGLITCKCGSTEHVACALREDAEGVYALSNLIGSGSGGRKGAIVQEGEEYPSETISKTASKTQKTYDPSAAHRRITR